MEHTITVRNQIMEILIAWDLGAIHAVTDIHPANVYKVECVTGRSFVLKNIGEHCPHVVQRFGFEYEVLCHLDRTGVSVALPLPDHAGEHLVAKHNHLYTLSPYLPTNDQWQTLDPEGLKRLHYNCGTAIARLHKALAAFPQENLERRTWKTVFPNDLFDQWIPLIRRHISEQERNAFEAIITDISADMLATTQRLPIQLIHRDCHPANIVVNGEQVSGFIDCDHLSLGPRIFDLADFLVHLIKQHVADRARTTEWFTLFPVVVQGYEAKLSLEKREKAALYYVMLGILLMLLGWFLKGGMPDKARSELDALVWMYHHQRQICNQLHADNQTVGAFN